MIEKLQERSPLKQKAVRGLSSLDPCVIQHSPQLGQKEFSFLLEELNHANIINDVLAENAKKEYMHFCNFKKSQLQEIFPPYDQFSDESGSLVTDGLENMDCGAVQVVKRFGWRGLCKCGGKIQGPPEQSSNSALFVHVPWHLLHTMEHGMPAFRHPYRPPHPVEHRQQMLSITSGATGSLVVTGTLGIGPSLHENAVLFQNETLLRKFASTDMVALEAKYYKACNTKFFTRAWSVQRSQSKEEPEEESNTMVYGSVLTELVVYFKDMYTCSEHSPVFKTFAGEWEPFRRTFQSARLLIPYLYIDLHDLLRIMQGIESRVSLLENELTKIKNVQRENILISSSEDANKEENAVTNLDDDEVDLFGSESEGLRCRQDTNLRSSLTEASSFTTHPFSRIDAINSACDIS
uniref:Uncharacterized protein n=1 Tax=Timema monikensis TaxID=170555 RepID=A0A7R9HRF4_9NEOP|nr:unnamed protein product [Timema monikensis]